MRDPGTDQEWQEAVDLASAALALDACRQYGLITGGPDIDVARCEELLAEGTERGFRPLPDAIERFTLALHAGGCGPERGGV